MFVVYTVPYNLNSLIVYFVYIYLLYYNITLWINSHEKTNDYLIISYSFFCNFGLIVALKF